MNINEVEDEGTRELIENAMNMRKAAALKKREAEALDKEANDLLLPLMIGLLTDTIVWDGMGKVQIVASSRVTLDKDKLKDFLVRHGVAVDDVVCMFNAASTMSSSSYVKFMMEREG